MVKLIKILGLYEVCVVVVFIDDFNCKFLLFEYIGISIFNLFLNIDVWVDEDFFFLVVVDFKFDGGLLGVEDWWVVF